MSIQNDGYQGIMDPVVPENEFNALSFLVNQILNKKWTATIALVKSVSGGGVNGPAIVSLQPMVNMIDGSGNATSHGVISNVPALRLQGGSSAFIADPVVGDIGIMICASRDISSVIANRAPANPGSYRTFAAGDAMFVCGLLGSAASQFIQITADGINVVFPGGISIALSSSGIELTVGSNVFAITSAGFSFNGLDYLSHTHAVTTAPGETGPVAG
jgi:hypothetical protein